MREKQKTIALSAAAQDFCRGCNAFETGLNRGLCIADNNPGITSPLNVIVGELSDDDLEKFKSNLESALENCNVELKTRKSK